MRPPALSAYLRAQTISATVINAVLNPLLVWLLHRSMPRMSGADILIDTVLTSLLLAVLVSLCVGAGVRSVLRAGRLTSVAAVTRAERMVLRMPCSLWGLGLTMGVVLAAVLVPAVLGWLTLTNWAGAAFAPFAAAKGVYTAVAGGVATRVVILRHVLRCAPFV